MAYPLTPKYDRQIGGLDNKFGSTMPFSATGEANFPMTPKAPELPQQEVQQGMQQGIQKPIQKDIPVEVMGAEVKMGNVFKDIPLEKEDKIKAYIDAKYKDKDEEEFKEEKNKLARKLYQHEKMKMDKPDEQIPTDFPRRPTEEDKQKVEDERLEMVVNSFGDKFKLASSEKIGLKEGLKDLGKFGANMPGDAAEVAEEMYTLLSSPVETTKGLLALGGGLEGKADLAAGKVLSKGYTGIPALDVMTFARKKAFEAAGIDPNIPGVDLSEEQRKKLETEGVFGIGGQTKEGQAMTDELGSFIKDNYGTIGKFKKALVENPVDTLIAMKGLSTTLAKFAKANNLTKLEKVANTINKISDVGLKPITTPVGVAGTIAKGTAKFGFKQLTGLGDDSIKAIFKTPELIDKAKSKIIERVTTGEKTLEAINKKTKDVSGLGKKYDPIRKSTQTFEGIKIKDAMNVTLEGRGIKATKKGLDFTDSNIGNKTSKTAIKDAYNEVNNIAKKGKITGNDVLNIRSKLDDLIDYKAQIPKKGQDLIKGIRKGIDNIAKENLKGLEKLDKEFAPKIKELNKLKKTFIDSDTGRLKDNAVNKIMNMTNRGREQELGRLEKLIPGITDEINAIRAMEDVELAMGNKVGTYVRAGIIGGGVATANPLLIAASILTSPGVIVPIIQAFGKANNYSKKIIGGIIDKIEKGVKFTKSENKIVSEVVQSEIKNLPYKPGLKSKGIKPVEPKPTPLKQKSKFKIPNNAEKVSYRDITVGDITEFGIVKDVSYHGGSKKLIIDGYNTPLFESDFKGGYRIKGDDIDQLVKNSKGLKPKEDINIAGSKDAQVALKHVLDELGLKRLPDDIVDIKKIKTLTNKNTGEGTRNRLMLELKDKYKSKGLKPNLKSTKTKVKLVDKKPVKKIESVSKVKQPLKNKPTLKKKTLKESSTKLVAKLETGKGLKQKTPTLNRLRKNAQEVDVLSAKKYFSDGNYTVIPAQGTLLEEMGTINKNNLKRIINIQDFDKWGKADTYLVFHNNKFYKK